MQSRSDFAIPAILLALLAAVSVKGDGCDKVIVTRKIEVITTDENRIADVSTSFDGAIVEGSVNIPNAWQPSAKIVYKMMHDGDVVQEGDMETENVKEKLQNMCQSIDPPADSESESSFEQGKHTFTQCSLEPVLCSLPYGEVVLQATGFDGDNECLQLLVEATIEPQQAGM